MVQVKNGAEKGREVRVRRRNASVLPSPATHEEEANLVDLLPLVPAGKRDEHTRRTPSGKSFLMRTMMIPFPHPLFSWKRVPHNFSPTFVSNAWRVWSENGL